VEVDQDGGQLLATLAFVEDLITWRRLLATKQPLVLVAREPSLANEVPSGTIHSVIAPIAGTSGDADINLAPLDSKLVADALRATAHVEDRRADELGKLARRSLTALRRNIAIKSALHRPAWASNANRVIRGMLLAGAWSDRVAGDRELLQSLCGQDYDEIRERAVLLSDPKDPFLHLSDSTWHIVSPVDAWLLLSPSLIEDDMNRLKIAVTQVLGEVDPTLEIAQEDRWWKASVEGVKRTYSPRLGRGLATTLALLGTYAERVQIPGGSSGSDWAEYVVRELLEPANADPSGDRWTSLSGNLPLLGEAAPEAVLTALERATRGEDPVARRLFTDASDSTGFYSTSAHSSLLWALETLAWSTDYFSRTVNLLARLDEIDSGGRLSNRPSASLKGIFTPWHPETAASTESRLTVFDLLRARHSRTAWKLGIALLPELHSVHFPSNAPTYRDWKPIEQRVTRAEWIDFVSAILQRCVADAGGNAARWIELIKHYSDLLPADQLLLRNELSARIQDQSLDEFGKGEIWNELGDLVGDHREFTDAHWSLPESELQKLDDLIEVLAPSDARNQHEWLFQSWRPHVGDVSRRDDYAAYDAEVERCRERAIGQIVDECGLDEVRDLASSVKVPHTVGWALAAVRPIYDDELLVDIADDDSSGHLLGEQYFARRFHNDGWPWLNSVLIRHDLSPTQRGKLLLASRDFPKAWEVAAENMDVAQVFWKNFSPFGLGPDFAHVAFVAQQLMSFGRNATALDILNIYQTGRRSPLPECAELVAQGLENLLKMEDEPEILRLQSYDFVSLFEYLSQDAEALTSERLANLQWAYLPVLGHEANVPQLAKQLAADPGFFVEVVCTVYRRHDGEPEPDADNEQEGREAKAHNAYRLLSVWNDPPGLHEGVMDIEALRSWLDEVESLLHERDRVEVGLQQVGKVLFAAPPDEDGTWPGEAVRNMLEERQDEQIELGLYLAILNSRGVVGRALDEGGVKEIKLATSFRSTATKITDSAPRTAALLRKVARSYDTDSRRAETEAERFRTGLN
jgi:hypothetical protein